jgi:hypothetical protein
MWMILVALLLGAMVNIAVAWRLGGVAAADQWKLTSKIETPRGPFVFHVAESPGRDRFLGILAGSGDHADAVLKAGFMANGVPRETFRVGAAPPSWSFPATSMPVTAAGQIDSRVVSVASGWPLPAMVYHRFFPDVKPKTLLDRIRQGLESPFGAGQSWHKQYVPLMPIWLGFAVNTILYALPFAGLAVLGLCWRAWARRRRGRCVRCGYEVAGLAPPCPECGAAF